jgi:ribosomal protein L29
MKKKDFTKEYKSKTPKELSAAVAEKKIALREFRFAVAGSKARNTKEGAALKKQIARLETLPISGSE